MHDLTSVLFVGAPFLAAGAAVGALYFLMLYQTVRQHAEGGAALLIVPLYILRLAAAALFFWVMARQGAVPLLFALAGFLLARSFARHLVQRA
jgi:F1F0 ATPase subunit 2